MNKARKYSFLDWESRFNREQLSLLTVATKKGDIEARNRILGSVLPYIYKLASKHTGDLDDLFQLAVEEIIELLDQGKFDPTLGALTTYVTQRVKWRLTDYHDTLIYIPKYLYRTTDFEPPQFEKVSEINEPSYMEKLEENQWNRVIAAMKKLSTRERKILIMWLRGSKLKEIGDKFHCTKEHVRVLKNQAIERLKIELGETVL